MVVGRVIDGGKGERGDKPFWNDGAGFYTPRAWALLSAPHVPCGPQEDGLEPLPSCWQQFRNILADVEKALDRLLDSQSKIVSACQGCKPSD